MPSPLPNPLSGSSTRARRLAASAAVVALAALAPGQVMADAATACAPFAGQQINFVVPVKAGGGIDGYARALAPVLTAHSGLSVTVVNMPSAGGRVGEERVAAAGQDELIMLADTTVAMVAAAMMEKDEAILPRLFPLGAMSDETSVLLARPDYELPAPDGQVVALTSRVTLEEMQYYIPAAALRVQLQPVAGYGGSSEMAAGLVRGDGDISRSSYTSSKRLTSSGELKVLMTLSDGPSTEAPELPYSAGEGGVVWQRTEDLPAEQRDALRRYAELTAMVTRSYHGLFTSAAASPAVRDCLSAATDAAIMDPAFLDQAKAAKLEPRPADGATFGARLDEVMTSLRENRDFMTGLFLK